MLTQDQIDEWNEAKEAEHQLEFTQKLLFDALSSLEETGFIESETLDCVYEDVERAHRMLSKFLEGFK